MTLSIKKPLTQQQTSFSVLIGLRILIAFYESKWSNKYNLNKPKFI